MNVTIIGSGYVGLVTGVCLSDLGHQVICYDIDQKKIDGLIMGASPIYEPGLEELIKKNLIDGSLHFTTDLDQAITNSEIIMITVGTPSLPCGQADLSQVKGVAIEIAQRLNSYKLIVVKSTVPVGTNDQVEEIIGRYAPDISFDVASNPEFLREGSAIQDTFQPDRIVIGSSSKRAIDRLETLYSPLQSPIIKVDTRSAEMIKYASNAFLATKISFINEIANLCDKVGANIDDVATGMGYDHRIGPHFLKAGVGYGGSCFPKDTAALVQIAGNVEYDFKILREVIEINNLQRRVVIEKLESVLGTLEGKVICILGLAFKPHTDDIRESAAIDIIHHLLKKNVYIKSFDPLAMENTKQILPKVNYGMNEYDALNDVDAALILTDWPQFGQLGWKEAGDRMKRKVVIDGRNMLDPRVMDDLGFIYHSIGRRNGWEK